MEEPADEARTANGREERLDPRSVTVSRIAAAAGLAIVGLGGAVALSVLALTGVAAGWIWILALVWGGAIVLGAALGWFGPRLRYRHTSYRVDPGGLAIRRGIVWRTEIVVPRNRVQHIDVAQGPVERGFDLSTLIVHTAGTQHASVALDGLHVERARQIRDFLVEGGEDDAV